MPNKYPGTCHYCRNHVPAKAGKVWRFKGRWYVAHHDCSNGKGKRIVVSRFSSGEEVYQNSRGRCEDAPCCGCCS